ncbi:peptidoglycan DD-metalloendopeptidase family protein [Hydrogenovibrio thermophilus]|jgi:murein DD-endopeptidase MepM/ murein hydrolase activator NlpD|uniref:LysM peptidoglycan-binding domain-containing protein n=1 Tax=Hydrogenovibrio thermophilus TaxID=265883 RepID=A0A410H3B2_9GAMM|nr:peptidoglycan DD-metalloendopeptidase family protein [Hydrogenovibrio thermophilus]QAB15412.1 LysM peptidoglycan-binding domain-containing protein [Hydrogenovibrio thermophilus]
MKQALIGLLLIEVVWLITGCAPARYRGEAGSRAYFDDLSGCGSVYVVRSGDTLSEIAARCDVDMMALADKNHLVPPYTLYVKQELTIPSGSSSRSTVSHRSAKTQPSSSAYKKANFSWPVKKKLKYEYVKDASGLNSLRIYGGIGDGVYAVAAGKVVYAGNGIRQYGNMVVIKHDTEHLTVYAHNDSLQVKEGQRVKKGQLIATLGQTGSVKKPELYVEARYRGRKIDIKKLF